MWDTFELYELQQIMRQKNRNFAECLNRLREGSWTDAAERHADISRLVRREGIPAPAAAPVMFRENKHVDECNPKALAALPGRAVELRAIDRADGTMEPELEARILALAAKKPARDTASLVQLLTLKQAAKVDMVTNLDTADWLTNGASGVVRLFCHDTNHDLYMVWVEFENESVGRQRRSALAGAYRLHPDADRRWTPVTRKSGHFWLSDSSNTGVTRQQFPLRLAHARTINRSQGLTFPLPLGAYADLRTSRSIAGLHYTACTRVTDEEGYTSRRTAASRQTRSWWTAK